MDTPKLYEAELQALNMVEHKFILDKAEERSFFIYYYCYSWKKVIYHYYYYHFSMIVFYFHYFCWTQVHSR